MILSNSIQAPSLQAPAPLPANLDARTDLNTNPLTLTASSTARHLINTLNRTSGGNLAVKVDGLEVTAEIKTQGSVSNVYKQTVTPATLQRAFCAFLSEVYTCLY